MAVVICVVRIGLVPADLLLSVVIGSVRRALTPRSDLGLLHWFLLPIGRPRLRFIGVDLRLRCSCGQETVTEARGHSPWAVRCTAMPWRGPHVVVGLGT
jgi:hypothetical protein